MRDSWTVIGVEQGPGILSNLVIFALKKAACELWIARDSNQTQLAKFSELVCEGWIESSWKSYVVASRSGIVFRALVDANAGSFQVNFMLRADDLERGADFLRDLHRTSDDRGELRETIRDSSWLGDSRAALDDFSDLSRVAHPRHCV